MAILKKNITSYGIVLGSIGIIDACICIFANIFGLINMDVVLLHLMKTKSFHSDKLGRLSVVLKLDFSIICTGGVFFGLVSEGKTASTTELFTRKVVFCLLEKCERRTKI
jgi:hypothetical protein